MKKLLFCYLLFFMLIIFGCTSSYVKSNNLCKQEVIGRGPCKEYFVGYQYDSNLKECIEKGVSGCEFETPFKSLEECRSVCEIH